MNIVVYILLIVGFGTGVLMTTLNNSEEAVTMEEEEKQEIIQDPTELNDTPKTSIIEKISL